MRVLILQSFTGFPDGSDASERHFAEGEVADDLPDDFAALIIAKGHAVANDASAPTPPTVRTKSKDVSQ